jgi:hypothetical protein
MDENTGTTITNYAQTVSMPGYFAGSPAPVWTNGVVGKALHGSGNQAYIYDIASGSANSTNYCAFIHTNAVFTIAFWARIHPGSLHTAQGILGNTTSSSSKGFALSYGSLLTAANTNRVALLVFYGSAGNYTINTESPAYWTNSAWHHIAVTCNGTSGQWYWDGVAAGSTFSVGTKGTGAQSVPMQMMYGGASTRLYGTIDDVRVYDVALTSADISSLYNGGAGTSGNP